MKKNIVWVVMFNVIVSYFVAVSFIEEFEDTKGVIRIQNRQHNGQKEKV